MPFPDLPDDSDTRESGIQLSKKDAREAARLLKLLSTAIDEASGLVAKSDRPLDRDKMVLRARIVLDSRQARAHYFNRAMFGEPAWDALLALYITDGIEGRQSLGQIADWIQTPLTTVTRWIDYLEKERLVGREAHPTDKRIIYIRLREKGRQLLDSYLSDALWTPVELGWTGGATPPLP